MKRKLDWLLKSHDVEIVFEDDEILVLNKPANLLVIPDRYDKTLPNVATILKNELGSAFVVHRIDRETSGLVVFAKTALSHEELNRQFEHREVKKTYLAIVHGDTLQVDGTIDLALSEDADERRMRADRKHGKESVTDYKVLERFSGYSYVEAKPRTGRRHQIRVHFRELGSPIVGDRLYGDGIGFFLSHVKPGYKNEGDEKPLLGRTGLHAAALSFAHPTTHEILSFEAPLPKDMRTVLKYLRKFCGGNPKLKADLFLASD